MRYLGLDVGSKTVGVAVSDQLGWTAQPITTLKIDEANQIFAFEQLEKIIQEYQIETAVIGLPKNMNNTIGERVEAVKNYGQLLENRFNIKIEYIDERLSTTQAQRMLTREANISRNKRKQVIDKMAATIILQSYLDGRRNDRR